MYRISTIFLILIVSLAPLHANDKYYEINDEIMSSYEDILSLNISDAKATLKRLKKSQPNNYSTLHLSNYIDFLELFTSESEWLYNRKLLERTARLDAIESNKEGKESPYHYYVLGEIHLQWALIKFKFQDYYAGFRDASKAYRYFTYMMLHYGNKKEASWDIINQLNLNTDNPTELFIKSNVAHYVGKNDLTIEMLSGYQQKPGAMPFHYLNYMLGVAKLNRLDDDADEYLLAYVNNFKGYHYVKDSYLRLAWHSLTQGDIIKYDHYLEKVKSEGSKDISFDKTAFRYAKERQVPNTALLKARLLYDGSYYKKADDLLSVVQKYSLKSAKDKLEYTYRLGRIRQQLNMHKEAIKLFKETIENGRYDKSHYACNSALQMGLIYESMNDSKSAISAYKTCLSINPADYKQSLHHRAKFGLQRLK